MTVVLVQPGLWLDWQNFLSVMGRQKQIWDNAAPVATLQLKPCAFNERRQREAFGNGNILLELNCQVQLWSFGEEILFSPALVLPPTHPLSLNCSRFLFPATG